MAYDFNSEVFQAHSEEMERLAAKATRGRLRFGDYFRQYGRFIALALAILLFIIVKTNSNEGFFSIILMSAFFALIISVVLYIPALIIYSINTKKADKDLDELGTRLKAEKGKKIHDAYVYYKESGHYEPVQEWVMGCWSRAISSASRDSYLTHVTVTAKMKVAKDRIVFSGPNYREESFVFRVNNYTDIPDIDTSVGFAQALMEWVYYGLLKRYRFDYTDKIRDEHDQATVDIKGHDNELTATYKAVNGNYIPPIDNRPSSR